MSRLNSTLVQQWAAKRKTFTATQVAQYFGVREGQARSAISILKIKEAVVPATPSKNSQGESVWVALLSALPRKTNTPKKFSAKEARPYLAKRRVVTPQQLARQFKVETQQAIAVIAYLSRVGELVPATPATTRSGATRWEYTS